MSPEQEALLAKARDPQTTFDRLFELAQHPEVEVRRALLDNPNLCPTDEHGWLNTVVLEKLARDFPEEVSKHPLFVLHVLIEPNPTAEELVVVMLQNITCPDLIRSIYSKKNVFFNVTICRNVSANPHTPSSVLENILKISAKGDWGTRRNVAMNPNTSERWLRFLSNEATETNPYVLKAAKDALTQRGLTLDAWIDEARNPETSFEHLEELANHPVEQLHRALLNNPKVCPLGEDGKLNTRLLLKLAPKLPEEVATLPLFVLHALIEPNEEFEAVVGVVAEHTKDVGLIEHVFRSWGPSSGNVRKAVASNPSTPEDLLRSLGNPKIESDFNVRQAVALNHRTPTGVLRILGNPETESHGWVREAVAENPNTPMDLLRTLGNQKRESDWVVRSGVAKNPSTPVDVLRILGNEQTESYWSVREAVASNPNTPEDLLRSLGNEATESKVWVREAAQKALSDRGLV